MKKYWMIAAALVLAACAKTEVEAPVEKENPSEKVWTVSVEATKVDAADATKAAEADGWDGDAAETKSLDNSVESRIDFYWSMTDYVEVYRIDNNGEALEKVGTLSPVGVGGSSTTLRGEITGSFQVGNPLALFFPKLPADETTRYANQKGTVADIAKNFDYAVAFMTVTALDSEYGELTLENVNGGSSAEFESAQSITKFSFSYASVNSEGIRKLTITAPYMAGEVTVIPDTPGTEFYVALPDSGLDQKLTYTFMAETESGIIYEATRKANLKAGKYYKALVNGMAEYKAIETPLTIEAREAGTITILNPLNRRIMYNAEGYGFTHMTTKVTSDNPIEIAVTAGQRVILGGENETYATGWENYTNISFSSDCYVYGNVMSLVNWQYYGRPESDSRVRTAKDWAFTRLFSGWNENEHARPHLLNHPVKTIELPATSVGKGAYRMMFAYCTNMTVAPELPAATFTGGPYDTTENNQPYGLMFYYCPSLRRGPSVLPATTVPAACYFRMFEECTSLEASPVLPAQYPGNDAYRGMFQWCTNLKQITCYAKGNLGVSGATRYWVGGVPSTGIFIKDPDASWPIGESGIPTGWTYDNPVPLTVEAVENGTLTITNPQGLSITWGKDISMASATTTSLTTISIPMTAGDKIRLWGDNACYGGTGGATYNNTNISSTAAHYVYGDIRSLLNKSDYPNVSSIPAWAFNGLFADDTGLRSHPDLALTMDAPAVGEHAMTDMFARCTGLVRAPSLPATSLAEGCYAGMFGGCTALTEAPTLPATTLATGCYMGMFAGCSSLVNAPSLPATSLAEWCYGNMFDSCSSIVTAPDLPAATLKNGCYSYMFRDCTSLRTVRCMATNPVLSDYGVEPAIEGNVDDWLENTYATGTFSKKSGVTWPAGSIPSGWSVTNL